MRRAYIRLVIRDRTGKWYKLEASRTIGDPDTDSPLLNTMRDKVAQEVVRKDFLTALLENPDIEIEEGIEAL